MSFPSIKSRFQSSFTVIYIYHMHEHHLPVSALPFLFTVYPLTPLPLHKWATTIELVRTSCGWLIVSRTYTYSVQPCIALATVWPYANAHQLKITCNYVIGARQRRYVSLRLAIIFYMYELECIKNKLGFPFFSNLVTWLLPAFSSGSEAAMRCTSYNIDGMDGKSRKI